MRLLHVVAGMDPKQGGVGQAVRTTIAGLAEYDVHSEVVSVDAPGSSWVQTDSFVTHALGPGRGPWSYSPQLGPWLRANLPRFDVVILHGLWLYQGYALRQALRSFRAPRSMGKTAESKWPRLFIMPHGMLDPYFQQASGRKLKAWRNWLYWRLLEGNVVNEANGVLFTCETERLLAHEPFTPYRPRRELVVGLGVEEPPPYTPMMREALQASCPDLHDRPYLLFLGRIHEKKGVDLLVQAYTRLASGLPTRLSRDPIDTIASGSTSLGVLPLPALIIAGPGLDTVYGQRMRQLVAELPASASVFFPGMLTGDAKWGAFYGCEAFILPSHQENFGIAVVEALSCGKPVLISNQVNIWREIEAAGGGVVDNDTLAGTQALLAHWNQLHTSDKRAFGEQAHAAYCKYFATGPAAKKMLAAILE